MKKILFVLTGGTIGSFSDDTGHNAPDAEKAVPILMKGLRESDSPYREQEFEVTCPLITLSENMSVDKWNMLIASLRNDLLEKLDALSTKKVVNGPYRNDVEYGILLTKKNRQVAFFTVSH